MKASAPAKLFLIGEYAVLDGGAAAVAALPQRARVAMRPDTEETLEIITTTHQLMTQSDARLSEPLFRAVVDTTDCTEQLKGKAVTLDTSEFFHKGQKLGLGSSAAMTVAMIRALRPGLANDEIILLADKAHRTFQGGRGSGADIAVAVLDSAIRYSRGEIPDRLTLPPDLYMLAIWTGVSASTRIYLEKLEAWRETEPDACLRHMDQLKQTSTAFFNAPDTSTRLEAIDRYGRYLNELSQDSLLNFYNEPHIALQKEVESARCLYKPSGAGGGDFGIAFSDDVNAIEDLAGVMRLAGRVAFRIDRSD